MNYSKIGIGKVPIHLDIEVTTRCNLRCIYCEQSFNRPKARDLDYMIYMKAIDEFIQKGGCSIKLCYVGEPLLHPKIIDMVQYARNVGIIDIIISTNGMLLNESMARGLIKAGLTSITFSVDSCKKEVYENIRIGSKFDRVVNNIRNFKFCKDIMNSAFPIIRIQTIIQPETKEEIESNEYHEFWEDYADEIRVHPYIEDYKELEDFEGNLDFLCPSPFRRMTLRADRYIAICCGTRSNGKIIGSFPEQNLEDLWNSERFKKIRKLMKEKKAHEIDICKRCSSRR